MEVESTVTVLSTTSVRDGLNMRLQYDIVRLDDHMSLKKCTLFSLKLLLPDTTILHVNVPATLSSEHICRR